VPFALAALALVLTITREGLAQTPEERRTALLKEAATALRSGRPMDAVSLWRAAWNIRPSPEVACDIGTGEAMYGSQLAAAEFLAICEREYPAASAPNKKHLEGVKENLKKAREQVGALLINVEERGAVVSIDGRDVGRAPLDVVFVVPGTHRIEVALDGYDRQEVIASVQKGEERAISIKLTRSEPTRPRVKPAPANPKPLPMPAPKSDGPNLALAVVGGAVAIVGAAVGVGFMAVADDKAEEARSYSGEMEWKFKRECSAGVLQSPCSNFVSAEEARRFHERAAEAVLIGAGVAAAATIAYIVLPRTFAKPTGRRSGAALTVYQW
jgi:hypothetical protein